MASVSGAPAAGATATSSGERLVERARDLQPWLREEQAATEERGYPSPELHSAFLEAGLYRCLQPRRFGGYEVDLPTWYRVVIELSRGCPSSGWLVALVGGHCLQMGSLFSEQAQAEAFGAQGDFRAPSRAIPMGSAVRDDAGWVIDGTWDYCSGAPHANHFMPVCYVPGTDRDGQPPELVYAVVPRSGWEMLDDWRGVLGMRGSGSHSIRVTEARVPDHFVVHVNLLDVDVSDATIGYRVHGNPLYAGRTLGFFHGELVAIAVGLGRAALDEYDHILRTRKTYVPPIVPRWQHHDFQRPFGLALGLVDAAEAVIVHGAELYMEYCRRGVEGGEPFTVQEDYRLFTQAQHAMRMVWEAVEMLFRTAGSTASRDGQPMQRYFRDMSMFRGHFSAQFENFAQMRAQTHFADAHA